MNRRLVILSVLIAICLTGRGADDTLPGFKPQIEEYVSFLQQKHRNPVDYLMGLFEKTDLVILCERAHPEITQYEFIVDLIRDPRFIEDVGHVFTELGTRTLQPTFSEFLNADALPQEEIDRYIYTICRNFSNDPLWEKTNYQQFLRDVYQINKSLQKGKKIQIHPAGLAFSWDGMTRTRYVRYEETLRQRDRLMADWIIERFTEIQESSTDRRKALVIMNFRHAFKNFESPDGTPSDNVGEYLWEAFSDNLANVLMNSVKYVLNPRTGGLNISILQDGQWDAAFAALGNPNRGFDFGGSPFGDDHFDYFDFQPHDKTYRDVFSGFVFYKPLKDHRLQFGLPGVIDSEFEQTLFERFRIVGSAMTLQEQMECIATLKTVREYTYAAFGGDDLEVDDLSGKINQWLIPGPASVDVWRRF